MKGIAFFFLVLFIPCLGFSQEDEDFPPPQVKEKSIDDGPEGCLLPEVAEFPGGYKAMKQFLEENINFPDSLQWDMVKVYVRFTVESNGFVGDTRVLNSSEDCQECREEAIRLVKSMPQWKPEKLGGKPVASYFDLPIVFRNDQKEARKDTVYKFVDQPAEFPGGFEEMQQFINKRLRYPNNGVCYEGKVYVRFIVRKSGAIDSIQVIRGIDLDLDTNAINVIKSMPNWKPGVIDSVPVDSYVDIPISFDLGSKD